MRALQVERPHTIRTVNVPTPVLDPGIANQILVRNSWVSICGSDIPFFTGSKPYLPYPLPWGVHVHECVGQVAASTAPAIQPGDWVVAIPDQDRGLAEYFLAQAANVALLPDTLEDRSACPLIQPLATVLYGLDRLGDVSGRTVAVVGLGSVGLLFCWLLQSRGAGRIIGIDPLEYRCRMAEELGAHRTFHLPSREFARAAGDNPGLPEADICIEAVGHQMQTINDCFDMVRNRGTVLAFGVPDQPVYDLEYEVFFRKNLQLLAAVTPPWDRYLAEARDLYLAHQEPLQSLVTHRLAITQAEQAFSLYENHQDGIIKVILSATDWT